MFNTSGDGKIFGEAFKMWSVDSLPNRTLITVSMHITNLDHLKDKTPRSTELPDSGMEKSNRILIGLDTVAIIPETDNQHLPNLIDSEAEWANKKKEKAKKCRLRKINLE